MASATAATAQDRLVQRQGLQAEPHAGRLSMHGNKFK
jgi:hypothetical protein